MKKNLLWIFAAIVACGIMSTSCEKTETIGDNAQNVPIRTFVSLRVKYEASASQDVLDNYALVGTGVLVRYVGDDGKVKSETFTGDFQKTVTIPVKETGVDAALQVLIVPKTNEEVAAIGHDVDVTTHMKLTYAFIYDDNTQTDEEVYTTENDCCDSNPTIQTDGKNFEKHVSSFGGYVPAMGGMFYTVKGNHYEYLMSSASFWMENKYYAPQEAS